jgi:hypothetical protein
MEIDELKEIWQITEPARNIEQVGRVLMVFGKDTVARFQMRLLKEVLLTAAVYLALAIAWYLAFGMRLMMVILFLLVSLIAFSIYALVKWRLLAQIGEASHPIKDTLVVRLTKLQSLMKLNVVAGTLSFPLTCLFFGWQLVVNRDRLPVDGFMSTILNWPLSTLIIAAIVFITLATLLLWRGNHWYMQKLYGTEVSRLKALVDEMS